MIREASQKASTLLYISDGLFIEDHSMGYILCYVRPDGAANHRAADWALMEARIAALTDGEVAARDEHYSARRRHAHDADALLRIGCGWLRCCRAIGLCLLC